jgi:hypothetical protein
VGGRAAGGREGLAGIVSVLEGGGDVGKGGGSRLCVWGGGCGGASNEGARGGLKKWVDPLQVRMGGGGKEGAFGRGAAGGEVGGRTAG